MALSKSLPSNFGIPATYWRISEETSINPREKSVWVNLHGFVDKDHVSETPLSTRGFTLSDDNYVSYVVNCSGDPRIGLYEFVKLQEEFQDAVDA